MLNKCGLSVLQRGTPGNLRTNLGARLTLEKAKEENDNVTFQKQFSDVQAKSKAADNQHSELRELRKQTSALTKQVKSLVEKMSVAQKQDKK